MTAGLPANGVRVGGAAVAAAAGAAAAVAGTAVGGTEVAVGGTGVAEGGTGVGDGATDWAPGPQPASRPARAASRTNSRREIGGRRGCCDDCEWFMTCSLSDWRHFLPGASTNGENKNAWSHDQAGELAFLPCAFYLTRRRATMVVHIITLRATLSIISVARSRGRKADRAPRWHT